ncbi:hypothetical protein DQ04_01191050 [Trypanosoma grayi]|uniref:hypothetical protein n=1 Tax=Trypanosoma grayi TaxID=71804 RepID=UPI0004F49715|nr:hypothetical protein DQ04_01191050 [Trypanosoma grayi]KEG13137.1 hypothetical protein DQ04_01191050 [Trypanosoma grayi]
MCDALEEDEEEKVGSATPASPSYVPRGKPPVVPRSNSCDKPKSILKNMSGSRSSSTSPSPRKRHVSFEDDECFSEPTLRYGAPRHVAETHDKPEAAAAAPPAEVAAGGVTPTEAEKMPTVARVEARPGAGEKERRRHLPERGVADPVNTLRQRGREESESPDNSPVIVPRRGAQLLPISAEKEERKKERAESVTTPEKKAKVLQSRAEATATPRTEYDSSPLLDVSVSDATPSHSSTGSQRQRSSNSMELTVSHGTPIEQQRASPGERKRLFPDKDAYLSGLSPGISPIPVEAHRQHIQLLERSSPPAFFGRTSSSSPGEQNAAPRTFSHSARIDSNATPVVRPTRIEVLSSSTSSLQQKGVDTLLFEGGVDPNDVDFDDLPLNVGVAAVSVGAGDIPPLVEPSYDRRVIDFPVHLFPRIVVANESSQSIFSGSVAVDSSGGGGGELLGIAEDAGGELVAESPARGRRRGRRDVWDGGLAPASPQPVFRRRQTSSPAPSDQQHVLHGMHPNVPGGGEPLALTEYARKSDPSPVAPAALLLKENHEHHLRFPHNSTAEDAAAPLSSSPFLDDPERTANATLPHHAKPVVVEYINKLSDEWQETLRSSGANRRLGSRRGKQHATREEARLLHQKQHEEARHLFPGVFFGQSPTVIEARHAICPDETAFSTSPLMPIRRTEVVQPRQVTKKKKRGLVEALSAANITTINNNNNNNSRSTRSNGNAIDFPTQETKPLSRSPGNEEIQVDPDEFEEIATCDGLSTPPGSPVAPIRRQKATLAKKHHEEGAKKSICTPPRYVKENTSGSDNVENSKKSQINTQPNQPCVTEVESDGEAERRARRYDKLRRALLQLADEARFISSPDVKAVSCDNSSRRHSHSSRGSNNNGRGSAFSRRRPLPPPLPSPPSPSPPSVTAEGLIHTPQRTASPDGSDAAAPVRPQALFAPARPFSPPAPSCRDSDDDDGGGGSRCIALESHFNTGAERCVNNRAAMKAFARDIARIVSALKGSSLTSVL